MGVMFQCLGQSECSRMSHAMLNLKSVGHLALCKRWMVALCLAWGVTLGNIGVSCTNRYIVCFILQNISHALCPLVLTAAHESRMINILLFYR